MKGVFKLFQKKEDPMVRLFGQNCSLCTFTPADAKALAKLLFDNKYYWATHEPLHHEEFYTEATQYQKIIESLHLLQANREFSFGIYDPHSGKLIGHISLYSIKRLPYASGFIGYSIDQNFIGRGIATEAVKLVLQFAFQTLNLHRVEAPRVLALPENNFYFRFFGLILICLWYNLNVFYLLFFVCFRGIFLRCFRFQKK